MHNVTSHATYPYTKPYTLHGGFSVISKGNSSLTSIVRARPSSRLLLEEASESERLSLVVEDEVGPHAGPQARVQPADLALDAPLHGNIAAAPAGAAALAPPPPAVNVLALLDCSPASWLMVSHIC